MEKEIEEVRGLKEDVRFWRTMAIMFFVFLVIFIILLGFTIVEIEGLKEELEEPSLTFETFELAETIYCNESNITSWENERNNQIEYCFGDKGSEGCVSMGTTYCIAEDYLIEFKKILEKVK